MPLTGLQPPGPPAPPSQMTYMPAAGPLARSAGDLRIALSSTAGPEAPAAAACSWALPAPRHERLQDFRVGVVLDDQHCPVSSEVGAPLSNAVDQLARAGVSLVKGWPPRVDPVAQYESFGFQVQLLFAFQAAGEVPGELSALIDQEARRMAARAAWASYFEDIDVFLCPVNFTPAFPQDSRPLQQRTITTPEGERPYADQPFWTAHAALAGLPAVVAPIGKTPTGLPAGIQILGPIYEDDTAITFAELLGELIGGFQAPPL